MSSQQPIMAFAGEFRWLSNFWVHERPMRLMSLANKTLEFFSVEHMYQFIKQATQVGRLAVYQAATPGRAKRVGQMYPMKVNWDQIKIEQMHLCLKAKFLDDPELKALLLSTGDAELIEGNTRNDTFWGICQGQGHNHLGKLLMAVRQEAQSEL